jgi:signal transduction histidine kinase/HAMP domain-containing protein
MRLYHEFRRAEGGYGDMKGRRSVLHYAAIGFAVQVAFIAGTTVFVLTGAISQDSAITATGRVSQLELANVSMQRSFLDAQRSLRGYQITGANRFLQSYYNARFLYTVTLGQARAAAWPVMLPDLERQARTAAAAYRLDDELAAVPAGSPRPNALFTQATRLSDLYVSQSDRLQGSLATIRTGLAAVAQRSLGVGTGATAGAIAVALIIPLAYTLFLTRGTIIPLRATTKTVRRLAAGDYSARTVPGGPAETWELAASINHLADENDRLRAVEEDRKRLKAAMRDTAVRIREHLRADAITKEAVTDLTERLACDRVWVAMFRDRRLILPAGDRVDAQLAAALSQGTDPFDRYDLIADIYRRKGSQPVDLRPSAKSEYSAAVREVLAATGGTHLLVVPFGTGQEPQGILALLRNDPGRPWTATEQAETESLAGEIARGMEHARMYQEEEGLVEQLRAVDRAKTSFIASASHDLQTPLTSIAGYAEMLMDGDLGPVSEQQAGALAAVERSTTRLRGLIEDMLTMSRIEMGVFGSELRPVDLAAAVPAAAEAIAPTAQEKGLHLDVSGCEPGLTVNADAAQLDRVLVNLLSNAVKYTPADGSVTVTAGREDGNAVLRVADTGIGIPEKEQHSLFTPFFRASNAVARAIPGSGLGLSIVATIIENHHGDIRLRSADGEGTMVTISLPLLAPEQGAR